MAKTNIKKIFGTVCLCAVVFAVALLSTACVNTNVSKEKLIEVNNTSLILDKYQTVTVKSTSTYDDDRQVISYATYHKDFNGNIVIQTESKYDNGEFNYSHASFNGLHAELFPSGLTVSFVITDNWNTEPAHQFNAFSKDNDEAIQNIKIENGKIVATISTTFMDETIETTYYFNKNTYMVEKSESIATNQAGDITFQGTEEFFYGKQITENSTVYQILSMAHGNFTEVTVNYVDSNESKIYYINQGAKIMKAIDYDNLGNDYKIYSDSECITEFTQGTMLGTTNALWIKKVTE